MAPKSSPIGFVRLHRIHAAPVASRVELADAGDMTWRGDGGDPALKSAIAYRLALCWNVLEGIPSAQLEAGAVRDLLDAVLAGDLTRAQVIAARTVDAVQVDELGRVHDCRACASGSPGDSARLEADDGLE